MTGSSSTDCLPSLCRKPQKAKSFRGEIRLEGYNTTIQGLLNLERLFCPYSQLLCFSRSDKRRDFFAPTWTPEIQYGEDTYRDKHTSREEATPLWRHIMSKRNNMADPLYCICRQPYDESQFMIQCDSCEEWYHGRWVWLFLKLWPRFHSKSLHICFNTFSCVGIEEHQASDIERYHCPECALLHGPLTRK